MKKWIKVLIPFFYLLTRAGFTSPFFSLLGSIIVLLSHNITFKLYMQDLYNQGIITFNAAQLNNIPIANTVKTFLTENG
ncbi:MAG TPA: hypothetical protein VF008_02680, partial [Niastella sp.]